MYHIIENNNILSIGDKELTLITVHLSALSAVLMLYWHKSSHIS